ncbi:hypothetical protein IFR05_001678 [Cadophora sp. M221]|nr:hypothetical protein IFR05_001678 [Cadophora sp. M221]
MWSSPEQLTEQGIAKPSDVFAFGLICIFVITKQEMLHPDFEEIDNNAGSHAEALMALLAAYFGTFPRELLTHINDEVWIATMEEYSKASEVMGQEARFRNWPQTDFPDLDACTKEFISRVTEHDPAKRVTMEELMADPWWSK